MNQFLRNSNFIDLHNIVYIYCLPYFVSMTFGKATLESKRLLSSCMSASKAQCLEYRDIQAGVSLAVWRNQQDHVFKEDDDVHTLSMYIEGGKNAYRVDKRDQLGGPGKMCLMPAGHFSEWYIDEPLRLIHLYFTDQHLSYLGLTAFDLDPRVFQLHDLTYETGGILAKGMQTFGLNIKSAEFNEKLMLQEVQQQLVLYLLEHHSQRKTEPIRGGLSPHSKKRVLDYIEDNLAEDIDLNELSDIACLSTYHFARMFHQSTGLSPYQYVLKRRLYLAKHLLKSNSIKQSLISCGFENHSRFARAFRHAFGIAPSDYQRAIA